jgi:hypothetical protein
MSRTFPSAVLLILISCTASALAQTADNGALPVPKSLEQGKVDRPLREKYKEEFASNDPAARGALAAKLRDQAANSADSTTKFVLLREARELAVGAGDMPLAMDIIDDIAAVFSINAEEMKASALSAGVDQARVSPGELGASYLKVADKALSVWNLDLAHKAAYLAEKEAAGNREMMDAAKERDKISRMRIRVVQQAADAERKLAKKPDDPQLNQTVGVYWCFNVNRWDRGLPYLVQSASPALKVLAEKDAAAPSDAPAMAELADAWWDFADVKSGLPAGCGHRRAAYWYAKALPKLTGDKKAEAEKRIADAG